MQNIGDVIRRLRNEQGYTLRELSELSGVSHTWISDIENGRHNPSLKSLRKLSSALGVKISDIFLESETV